MTLSENHVNVKCMHFLCIYISTYPFIWYIWQVTMNTIFGKIWTFLRMFMGKQLMLPTTECTNVHVLLPLRWLQQGPI